MSDYCGGCQSYSYVRRYGRGGWQFGYCQDTTCFRSWARKTKSFGFNNWKDEEECVSAPPSPHQQQLALPATTAAVELKPSENPPTPPSSSYSSSDNESYDVSDKCTQTGPVFVFDVTEKYKDDYAAFIAWKQQCDKTAAPKQAPRKSAVASKPSSEAPPKSTVEELKQRAMAAMNLPKKAEMASAKKRVHVSHETVIEEVSNSEGAEEKKKKKKKKKKNKSVKESRRNSSRKDKKKFKQ